MARRKVEASEPVTYGAIRTPWGRLWIAVSEKGVVGISFRAQSAGKLAEGLLRRSRVQFRRDAKALRPYEQAISAFLAGNSPDLELPADLRGESAFARRVYEVARRIPPGETRSYGEIADRVGGRQFARAVGQALAANPVPILIPCHRVVAGDGSLGGFSAGLGWKRRLLALERGQTVLQVSA